MDLHGQFQRIFGLSWRFFAPRYLIEHWPVGRVQPNRHNSAVGKLGTMMLATQPVNLAVSFVDSDKFMFHGNNMQ